MLLSSNSNLKVANRDSSYGAKNIAGSRDAEKQMLTIMLFDVDNRENYVNQQWNTSKPPFGADTVNAKFPKIRYQ